MVAEPAAADRPDQVADRARERHREVGREAALELVAEERHRLAGEGAGGDRARVDHDELAGRGEHRVDQHQEEDGVEAVVPDHVRDRVGEAVQEVAEGVRDEHRRGRLAPPSAGLAQRDRREELGPADVARGDDANGERPGEPAAVHAEAVPDEALVARVQPAAAEQAADERPAPRRGP